MAKQSVQSTPTIEEILRLYEMHNEQVMKYHEILWQIPTALLFGNFLAIEAVSKSPWLLLGLNLFDFVMILVLHRLIKQQRSIAAAASAARSKLPPAFVELMPQFKRHKFAAARVTVGVLVLLASALLVYAVDRIVRA